MPRFFVEGAQIEENRITILGDDAHHISRSLRMAAGETVTVCDREGTEYQCELTSFLPDRVIAKILTKEKSKTEPPFRAWIYQGLPKGEKLDSIVQKAVECGAAGITPFESAYCVVRVKDELEAKKTERRNRIALEAAKQSGRAVIPPITPTLSFRKMLEEAGKADFGLFCYEDEHVKMLPEALRECVGRLGDGGIPEDRPIRIAVCVGSEGGFSEEEVREAKEAGLVPVGLGPRILRTETAASFVLACLCYELELGR